LSAFSIEKNINCFTFATFAACSKAILPSQSTSFTFRSSVGLPVDASTTAVIPLKASGNVSGEVKSP
jgi:hypothetical protein